MFQHCVQLCFSRFDFGEYFPIMLRHIVYSNILRQQNGTYLLSLKHETRIPF